jgi:hydrogenase maturation protein HypF
MLPSIQSVETICDLSDLEKRTLGSPERPIVILKAKEKIHSIASNVAPGNPHLACMLPYTPLHHLLMNDLGFPVVATSGNVSDEPICTDESDALTRLGGIADAFLVHNRPIVRHVDDSIVRIMAGRETVLRRARGLAPLPFQRKQSDKAVLAVGAHLKNTIAASAGDQTFLSQHIGDLETPQAIAAFKQVIESVDDLYAIEPKFIACDTHPDYTSTRFAKSMELQTLGVQHHYAHVLSCMAENDLEPPVLGITWDGTGFGDDGTIWGGEFLEIGSDDFERVAHYRTFPLPGGEKAVRQPRRAGLGVLYEAFGNDAFEMSQLETVRSFDSAELEVLKHMLSKGLNCPLTSSVGRLFDAVASIVGLRQYAHFEGQAAMQLEFAIGRVCDGRCYDFELATEPGHPVVVDWMPVIIQIIADVHSKIDNSLIAVKFHNTLVETMVCISKKIGVPSVALSGGCFQNKYLLERAVRRLEEEGLRPSWHQRVPTNDGGIALGQTLAMDRFISSKGVRGSATS